MSLDTYFLLIEIPTMQCLANFQVNYIQYMYSYIFDIYIIIDICIRHSILNK
jgi:hypothetical protein